MKIVITGSSGFIGKHLISYLKSNRQDIKLVEIDFQTGTNILNKNELTKIEDVDCVIHLAAKSYVPESYINPYDFYYTNVIGTLNVLEFCRQYKARMIFLSSYVYGIPDEIPVDENQQKKAFNPYSQSKLICEDLCNGYNRDFNIPIIIFRPFNIYGIGQNTAFLIPSIFKQIQDGQDIIKLKDPYPKRDFVYIDDVVKAITLAIEKVEINYETLNICTGVSYSVKEVTEIIQSLIKEKICFHFNEKMNRVNEVNDTRGSINKISKLLSWTPTFTLEKGISDIVNKLKL